MTCIHLMHEFVFELPSAFVPNQLSSEMFVVYKGLIWRPQKNKHSIETRAPSGLILLNRLFVLNTLQNEVHRTCSCDFLWSGTSSTARCLSQPNPRGISGWCANGIQILLSITNMQILWEKADQVSNRRCNEFWKYSKAITLLANNTNR